MWTTPPLEPRPPNQPEFASSVDVVTNIGEIPLRYTLEVVSEVLQLHLEHGEVAESACSAFWALCLYGERLTHSRGWRRRERRSVGQVDAILMCSSLEALGFLAETSGHGGQVARKIRLPDQFSFANTVRPQYPRGIRGEESDAFSASHFFGFTYFLLHTSFPDSLAPCFPPVLPSADLRIRGGGPGRAPSRITKWHCRLESTVAFFSPDVGVGAFSSQAA